MIPKGPPKWLSADVGAVNKFVATIPTVSVSVRLQRPDGEPMAHEPWEAAALEQTGTTAGDGTLQVLQVPLDTLYVQVVLTRLQWRMRLNVGHLDPVTTPSGKAQRLAHLGFLGSSAVCATTEQLSSALERFRLAQAPGAQSDADVEQALAKSHGV